MSKMISHAHWQIAPDFGGVVYGEADIHQCISNILMTRKGSDVLRPDFGSNHFDYVDQPFDVAAPNMVREVHEAIEKWESRAKIDSVDVTGEAPHLIITVRWLVAESVTREIYSTEVAVNGF